MALVTGRAGSGGRFPRVGRRVTAGAGTYAIRRSATFGDVADRWWDVAVTAVISVGVLALVLVGISLLLNRNSTTNTSGVTCSQVVNGTFGATETCTPESVSPVARNAGHTASSSRSTTATTAEPSLCRPSPTLGLGIRCRVGERCTHAKTGSRETEGSTGRILFCIRSGPSADDRWTWQWTTG